MQPRRVVRAATELGKARPQQKAINATVKLAQGDAEGAAQSMANVQATLNAARERVAAADRALQSNDQARLQTRSPTCSIWPPRRAGWNKAPSPRPARWGSKRHHRPTTRPPRRGAQNNQAGKPTPNSSQQNTSGAPAPLSEGWSELLKKNTTDLNAARRSRSGARRPDRSRHRQGAGRHQSAGP